MEISKKLKEQGWYLTDDGLKKVIAAASTAGAETSDVRKIIATAMDMDFRDIAGGALPTKREESIPGRIVLQIQKIRNISAPKSNEESKAAPRFLQLELSDGQTTVQALELENVPTLSLNVPPGTKIYFRAERIQLLQGFVILRAADLQVLGGRVEALVEKWELARTMQKYARSGRRMSGAAGPPPWIPFGKKMETPLTNERNFKSLQTGADKDKETKENEEFNAMRNEAIAEATKAGSKKIFGGGGQQILDHNVKKILEKGYSEEDAKQALRSTNNNLERALYNLKRRQDYRRPEESYTRNAASAPIAAAKAGGRGPPPTRELGGGKRGMASVKEEAAAAKPAANVSLFDFLTDKLPTETSNTITTTSNVRASYSSSSNMVGGTNTSSASSSKFEKSKSDVAKTNFGAASKPPTTDSTTASSRPKFENNISSSFAANRPSVPRGGRGGGSSGRGGRGGSGAPSNSYTPRDGGNERPGPRSYNSSTSANYNQSQGGRSNRGSHERSAAPSGSGQQESTGGYNSRRNNEQQQQNRGSGERYGGYSESKGRYNQRDNNNRQQNSSSNIATTTPNANNNNTSDHAARMNKLTEATGKMKIDKSRSEQSTSARGSGAGAGDRHNSQQQQQQQQYSQNATQGYGQQQQQNTFTTQLPNGFTYDPSKIIGFQNKETNEFAMTLLKSQGMSATTSQKQQLQQEQQVPVAASAPTHHTTYVPAAVSPMQAPPAASPYAAPTTYILPNPQPVPTVAPIPSHFGMVPGDGWMWKIGDLCLAKYWDDGRYYEAEITAISDKTCVVFFLGYGNHEEVLKSDCLPITDANHRPINSYNAPQQAPPQQMAPLPLQSQPPQMQPSSFQRGGGGGGSQRYRGERQVYVPPHKRDN